ncbi:tetratricopeptide repeat protein [Nisaea acidiphila]|uniref:Tetratricopeptide repeat protein n=1 Tax=Nisaea acidiphila TaxID=1862145 RepID=A0A9J7AWH2_9PROT|nr:tetratricopeptide repeat protein [Nisaea acidiphila]UUX50793.1 tetratricopeptide repeat protein [Nisaea acidiphila]
MSEDLGSLIKLVDSGQADAAEPGLVAFVDANPRHPAAQFYLGIIRFRQGRNGDAAAAYAVAAEGLPGVAAVHSNLALACRRAGKRDDSVLAGRRATILAPEGAGPYVLRAEAAAEQGESHVALRAALQAFVIDPAAQSGLLLEAARRADDAKWIETAVARLTAAQPSDRARSINSAYQLMKNGFGAEAEQLYRELLERHPNDQELWYNLGVTLIESDRFEEAAEPYARRARLIHGRPLDDASDYDDLPVEPVAPVERVCARHRLKHDAEQYRYLTERGVLPADYEEEWKAYRELLDGLSDEEREAVSFMLDDKRYDRIRRSYNRFVHIAASGWNDEDPMNPDLDWAAIEESYLDAEPKAVAIDSLLNEEALARIRRFCFESTIWHQIKGAGYLGAYYRSGFNDPLLFAIGRGLRERLPRILGPHGLKLMWAYKYDQHMSGINPHADFAAVNVNFWINHAESNLDKETGGLLVFRKPAPKDWTFERYNTAPAEEIYAALGEDRHNPIRVANRENRALLFDSRLFHETDRFSFRDGYIHRRINITMLFGHGGT